MNRSLRNNLYKLTVCAVMIALATALSLVKVLKMPLGGSITIVSMLPICLLSIMFGLKWGLGSAFVYASVQFLLDLPEALSWGMSPTVWAGMIIFDYFIAFTVLGLSGVFRQKKEIGALAGTALALTLRFLSHLISGTFFFDIWMPENWNNAFFYSVCYNGSFMLPELIATAVVLFIILKIPAIKKIVFEQNGLPFTK